MVTAELMAEYSSLASTLLSLSSIDGCDDESSDIELRVTSPVTTSTCGRGVSGTFLRSALPVASMSQPWSLARRSCSLSLAWRGLLASASSTAVCRCVRGSGALRDGVRVKADLAGVDCAIGINDEDKGVGGAVMSDAAAEPVCSMM